LDLISPGLLSQEEIRRKIFRRKPLVNGDLRDRAILNNRSAVAQMTLFDNRHSIPSQTKLSV
jgi:hypothetical protein